MKISLNWLKQYIDLPKDLSPEELALKLTMSTVEVEEVIDLSKAYENMVVGEIINITDHPDADRLKVCKVKAGKNEYQVVCGGKNIYQGMKGILALPGAKVRWHGQGELITMAKAKIRGVESEGMLAAASEIGLAEEFSEEEGVIDLGTEEFKSGQSAAQVLGFDDVILEIDNKSLTHRSDLWGHYGMAREIAAFLDIKLKELELADIKNLPKAEKNVNLKINIEDRENCSRYMGLALSNVKIQPSPFWLRQTLKSIGVRPINNVVDISNYVMFELGRPSHAFDRNKIKGDQIIVRRAKNKEKLVALDGQIKELTDQMCLVCDADRPVDLAGVMGGQNSEIDDQTTEIILELANFNPVNIRKTATSLNLRTEAAMRFEKGLDPELAEIGLKRLVYWLVRLIPEIKVASDIVDVSYEENQEREIELSLEFLNKRIGQEIPAKEVKRILQNLGFEIKEKKEILKVTPPSFRTKKDISIAEDLVEEITRIYGFDNLEPNLPSGQLLLGGESLELRLERKIKDILTLNMGATEVYNYSFSGQENLALLGLDSDSRMELKNYFSEEQKYLRGSLFEGLVMNLRDNLRFAGEINLFEIGRIFSKDKGEYKFSPVSEVFLNKQAKSLAGIFYKEDQDESFYFVKGQLVNLLNKLDIRYDFRRSKSQPKFINENSCLEIITSNEESLGWFGLANNHLSKKLELKNEAILWQFEPAVLLKYSHDTKKYQQLPKYPSMIYDFSVLIDHNVLWEKIEAEVREVSDIIKDVELFDIFRPKDKLNNKKSLSFHVKFLDEQKTLTSDEANILKDKINQVLKNKFNAEIR